MGKNYLKSTKKIYDPILGFISFDEFERMVIDSVPFQRLHYIRQLGIAYFVYPGATHTRFEHSLGVMSLSSKMFKRLCQTVRSDLYEYVPRKNSPEYKYWLKVIRIAALLHDIGHIPFSQVLEKEFFKDGQETITLKLIESSYYDELWEKLKDHPGFEKDVIGRDIKQDIIKVAINENKLKKLKKVTYTPWERLLSSIISGDFFGANRMDYILRDSQFTGIIYGNFDCLQLIEMMRILPSIEDKEILTLGIDEKGIESCEALFLSRYFMHKKVYQHPSVKAYNFHLLRFLKSIYSKNDKIFSDISKFLNFSDTNIIYELYHSTKDSSNKGYNDAKSIVERKKRFKAILLPKHVDNNFLENFKKNNNIQDNQIFWEMNTKDEIILDFSFPVSKKYLYLQKASDCSTLLSKLPSSLWNWVYISPQYQILLLQEIYR